VVLKVLNKHEMGVASTQHYITLSTNRQKDVKKQDFASLESLEHIKTVILRHRKKLHWTEWRKLNLTIQVLKGEKRSRVTSQMLKEQLALIFAKVSRYVMSFVKKWGREHLKNFRYRWARKTVDEWRENEGYCLTAGLHSIGAID